MKAFLEKYYGIVPLAFLCVFFAWKAVDFPVHDFTNYYFGGYFLANNTFDSHIYFPYHFNKAIADLGYRHLFGSYAPNTPFLALLFLPFSFLKLASAKLLFNGISIFLFGIGISRLASFHKIKPVYLFLIPVLFFIPIKNNILFGQVYFLLFFLLSEGWLAYHKKQFKIMGFLLGFAILLKVFPLLLILLFIFKKEFKPLLFTAVSCAVLLLISMVFSGVETWIFFIKIVLPKAANGEIATAFVDNYQSAFMFFKRMLVFDAVENRGAVAAIPQLFPVLMIAFKATIICIGFYISGKFSNILWRFSYWILAMILLSPYGSTYTFVLLILPYFALAKSKLAYEKKAFLFLLLFLTSNIPLDAFKFFCFPFSFMRLFCFGMFFLSFILIQFKIINWKMVGLAFVIPFALLLIPLKDDAKTTGNLIDKNVPVLIYDYKIESNELTYFYWDEKGKNQAEIPFKYTSVTKLEISKNQIFSKNIMLTCDNSHKYNPMLIDGKTVIYLSDYERGIGFYTLRKIDLH